LPYREFRRKVAIGYFTGLIVALSALAGLILWSFQDQAAIASWVEHSDRVIQRASHVEIEARQMQSNQRAYWLTSDRRFVDRFTEARRALDRDLTDLAAMVADNRVQERQVLDISDLKNSWIAVLEPLGAGAGEAIDGKKSLTASDARANAFFAALNRFVAAEDVLRARRSERQIASHEIVFVLVPILTVLVTIFLSYWGWRQIQIGTASFRDSLANAERARDEAQTARELAVRASRAKDNFISTVSHELRTPLNSIMLWSAALLRKPKIDDRLQEGLAAIDRAVKAQAQLIDDLLDISRIESGRMRLDVQRVNLAEVVRAGVESMRLGAEAKSIELQEIIDPRVDTIAGDPGRLQQVVWNLVSNAVKFTSNGGKIQVRLERINSHVEIVVADTGQGIEPAVLDSVFDRFWQAEDGAHSRHGVGLGLSIVKEIVGLHGGSVSAHSEGAGKGSTFIVRLPLPVSTVPSLDLRRHPTVAQSANSVKLPRLDGLSILVVDDEPDAGAALKNLLDAVGANVVVSPSAQSALRMLEDQAFDAIISDIGMPVHDGYFMAREVRKWEQRSAQDRRIPLIALTAYGRVEDKLEILTAGFDGHAVKPVEPAELATMLSALVAARKGVAQA